MIECSENLSHMTMRVPSGIFRIYQNLIDRFMMGYISRGISCSAISNSMANYQINNSKSMIIKIMLFFKLILAQNSLPVQSSFLR